MVLLMKEYPEHGALTNERTYVKKVSWLMPFRHSFLLNLVLVVEDVVQE